MTEKRLLDLCWNRLSAALPRGINGLRSRHEAFFSERMTRTDISLGSVNATQTCSGGSIGGRLKSFGAGCKRDAQEERERERERDKEREKGTGGNDILAGVGLGLLAAAGLSSETTDRPPLDDVTGSGSGSGSGSGVQVVDEGRGSASYSLEQVVDVKLVSQAFMYGRYLLFSSATQSPLNLQGIWTDGPSASWNGTYPHRQQCSVVYCIVLYCIVLYCIVSYCIVLYCIALYCIVLYRIVSYCIVLYCTILYCTVLYYTILY